MPRDKRQHKDARFVPNTSPFDLRRRFATSIVRLFRTSLPSISSICLRSRAALALTMGTFLFLLISISTTLRASEHRYLFPDRPAHHTDVMHTDAVPFSSPIEHPPIRVDKIHVSSLTTLSAAVVSSPATHDSPSRTEEKWDALELDSQGNPRPKPYLPPYPPSPLLEKTLDPHPSPSPFANHPDVAHIQRPLRRQGSLPPSGKLSAKFRNIPHLAEAEAEALPHDTEHPEDLRALFGA